MPESSRLRFFSAVGMLSRDFPDTYARISQQRRHHRCVLNVTRLSLVLRLFEARANSTSWRHHVTCRVHLTLLLAGTLNLREWTMQEWTYRHDMARVDIRTKVPQPWAGVCTWLAFGRCHTSRMCPSLRLNITETTGDRRLFTVGSQ